MIRSFPICFITLTLAVLSARPSLHAQTDGSLQWSFAMQGAVVSSPAIGADGTIYVGSEGRRLWAVDANGNFKWRFPADLISTADWFDASPVVGEDGTVYIGSFDGILYAVNPNGSLKWRYSTGSYIYSSAALAADGTIYVGSGVGALHAINPDGTLKWTYLTGDWVDSSPAIAADGTVYFGSWDGNVYALNANGTLQWSVATGNAILSSPAIGPDGTIYIGSSDKKLWAIRADGTAAWTFLTGDSVDAAPVIGPDGNIYFGSADGYFYALRPDGTKVWSFDAGQGVFGAAVIRSDGSIVFGASDRSIYALHGDGTLKWKYSTGDIIDSSPTIAANGSIYIGSYDGYLYALNGNGTTVAEGPWPKFRRDALNQAQAISNPESAPMITKHPESRTIDYGTSVTFSVEVTGTTPFSYQWQKNGVAISGASGSSYVIAQAVASDAANYSVRVTNSIDTVASEQAALTLNEPIAPEIVTQPRPLVVAPGGRISLWVNVSGSAPHTYQWLKNGTPIADATTPFYEVGAALAGDAGSYSVVVTNDAATVTSADATVSVDSNAASRLVNLSSRAYVGTGDSILIPGFVLSGTGQRRLLVRAIGPSLDLFDVTGYIEDPKLTLYSGSTALLGNDNWGESANAEAIATTSESVWAFALDETSKDAAALVDLSPGAYTIHVSGVGGGTGVGLVELYDAGAVGDGDSRLVNISARAYAGTGAAVMIPGFVVKGTGAKTLLIRAVGPSLDKFGVQDFLADPVLRLFQGSTEILANDDWMDAPDPAALSEAFDAVWAFALEAGSADAAMLVVLMPGSYTVHASGVGGTTGNVLMEVYEVP